MAWDFETEPAFQVELDWIDEFVTTEVEPLDLVLGNAHDRSDARANRIVQPLQDQVKSRGLWACHLGPDLGGRGYGQLKLALMNELLGRSRWAPTIFGCQAPDSGNAEILARFGTPDQKAKYLEPLVDGRISSCYSMTEPHAGADPTMFRTRAELVDGHWVINGEKWFSSYARYADFLIVMAVTGREGASHDGMSMLIVPADTPGLEIVRNVGLATDAADEGIHGYVRYTNVRVPKDHLLGDVGAAFAIAQTRLGGGRVHHAMRTIAQVRKAFAMMCERAVSRPTRNGNLASFQLVQEQIAESWMQIEQFRLLVLRTAWLIDKHNDYKLVRRDIAAVKALMPTVYHDVVLRAIHLHGALGVSNELPLGSMLIDAESMALADGPTEVHKLTVAKQLLRNQVPSEGVWPSYHLPTRKAAAEARLATMFEQQIEGI